MNKENKFISIVAYVNNNLPEIKDYLTKVLPVFVSSFSNCELILVVDGPNESELQFIHEYYQTNPADYIVSIIKLGTSQGLESAMNAGRDMAIGDYVYEFDDLYVDYPMDLIHETYNKCISGYDIVSAKSDARARFTSRAFYHVYNKFNRSPNKISGATFRILSRRAINRVKSIGTYIPYRKAIYMNCGLKVCTLSYHPTIISNDIKHSHSDERVGLAINTFIYFTQFMEKISLFICIAFFVLSIITVGYVIYSYFLDKHLITGWVSMMGFLSVSFMGIFTLLTVVLKYLSVLVDLVFRHQRYFIEDIEKISRK